MKTIIVCVDYSDILSATLPYNRHHLSEVMVVTCSRDRTTQELCKRHDARCFVTDSFYADGAAFNKFRAMEEGLNAFGRHGWMCIMDADVLWPKKLTLVEGRSAKGLPIMWINGPTGLLLHLLGGYLCTPRRRMLPMESFRVGGIPPEELWSQSPLHPQQVEFAGYSQIFHADDPALGPPPWHETNWRHAGGADSFFQMKWPAERKVRPPFEVLHIGEAGTNWCGRVEALASGEVLPEAAERSQQLREFIERRRATRSYDGEKL